MGTMFGLPSLIYARDCLQGLQSQWNSLASMQENDELCTQTWKGARMLPKSKKRSPRGGRFEEEPSSATLGYPLTLKSTATNASLTFLTLDQEKLNYQGGTELVPENNDSNPPHPLLGLTSTTFSENITANSCPLASSRYNFESNFQRATSPSLSKDKFQSKWGLRNNTGQIIRSIALGTPACTQLPPRSHRQPLLSSLNNREYISSPLSHGSSKLGRLSPLPESSGNIGRGFESEQQSLVIQKTRNIVNSVSHKLNPADENWQIVIHKRSLKSLFSPRSSFAEDYSHNAAFLGRYRAPSSPDLRFRQRSEQSYHIQNCPRASSLSSLRHLPADRERSLYIGVNNHKIFIPPKSDRSSTPFIAYRIPTHKERRTPSMTPFAIVGPRDSRSLDTAMSSTPVTGNNPVFGTDSVSSIRRTASNIAVAGSTDSIGSDETLINARSDVAMTPADTENSAQPRPMGLSYVASMAAIILHHHTYPSSMLPMVDVICIPSVMAHMGNKPPQSAQIGFYHEFAPDMTPLGTVSVNSKTSFNEPFKDTNYTKIESFDKVRLQKCKKNSCDVLTDHDEAYACWHPEMVDHQKEEQSTANSITYGIDCSTTVTPTSSPKKSNEFWVKIGSMLKGCFGASQDI